jgi:hypothetical protein
MNKPKLKWPIWMVLAACLAGVLWYAADDIRPLIEQFTGEQPAPVVVVAPVESGPRFPIKPPLPVAPAYDEVEVDPLPPLAESDDYFRTTLIGIFGSNADEVLVNDELIVKFVATVDSLSAANPPQKIWPVTTRLDSFKAVAADDGTTDEFYLSPDNYARYDFLVNLATSPAPETIAAAYRRMYPLYQEAYIELGYPDGYFNDRLVTIIDLLLSTPEPAEPIRLVRPHVLYKFADPELEALSGGQKLLIRMGGDNAAKIRQMLQAFRQLIVQPAEEVVI